MLIRTFCYCLLAAGALLRAETPEAGALRKVLLEQLQTTHNKKDWFVPVDGALEGITAEQARWTDGHGNHSIGQLAYHLLFWNTQELQKFKGEKPAAFSGNNDDTFNNFDKGKWEETVRNLDRVLTDWEKAVATADDQKLVQSASLIAHVGAHNAYHTGQIIYVRRLQGVWDGSKGVK